MIIKLADSERFYAEHGKFVRVDVPWTVSEEICNITKPIGAKCYRICDHKNGKVLVASAEQSFLYQYAKGYLPKGRFQAITPCFRFETHDQFHQKSFIKNELIITDYVDRVHLDIMVSHAQSFFESKLEDAVSIVETSSNSMDIEYKGVELGSYGIRHCEFLSWIYGTGVAEPRFSTVMRNKKFLAEKYELSFKKD